VESNTKYDKKSLNMKKR